MTRTLDLDEYRSHLVIAHAAAQVIRDLPLSEMLGMIGTAHAIGPILDPTLYLRRGSAMQQDEAVLGALRAAQARLEQLPWPEKTAEAITPPSDSGDLSRSET